MASAADKPETAGLNLTLKVIVCAQHHASLSLLTQGPVTGRRVNLSGSTWSRCTMLSPSLASMGSHKFIGQAQRRAGKSGRCALLCIAGHPFSWNPTAFQNRS